jgi:hypothetical protein
LQEFQENVLRERRAESDTPSLMCSSLTVIGKECGTNSNSMDVVKILPGLPKVTSRITGDINAFQRILDANEVEKTVKNKNIHVHGKQYTASYDKGTEKKN